MGKIVIKGIKVEGYNASPLDKYKELEMPCDIDLIDAYKHLDEFLAEHGTRLYAERAGLYTERRDMPTVAFLYCLNLSNNFVCLVAVRYKSLPHFPIRSGGALLNVQVAVQIEQEEIIGKTLGYITQNSVLNHIKQNARSLFFPIFGYWKETERKEIELPYDLRRIRDKKIYSDYYYKIKLLFLEIKNGISKCI